MTGRQPDGAQAPAAGATPGAEPGPARVPDAGPARDWDHRAEPDPMPSPDPDDSEPDHRLADWRALPLRRRLRWLESLWHDALALRRRYRLALRSRWWEDAVQVEALAALAAWVQRYDSGEWDDPPGKLALLCDLQRVEALLRDGGEPFEPARDRARFLEHLRKLGDDPQAKLRAAPMEDDG